MTMAGAGAGHKSAHVPQPVLRAAITRGRPSVRTMAPGTRQRSAHAVQNEP
jgi:hypothetical protein